MSYEEAVSTRMVATHCAICHRDLRDALSVEVGVGPICRKRHLKELAALDNDNPSRVEANKIIHAIACNQRGDNLDQIKALFALGFPGVVTAIMRTIAKVKIEKTGDLHPHGAGRLAVKSPFTEAAVRDLASVPGRRWFQDKKHNTFPVESKKALWAVLVRHYTGELALGPRGPFVIRPKNDN